VLIAVFHRHETTAAAVADAAGAPQGAAVSWVAGRFYIHGRGEVSLAELVSFDAAGDLSWIDLRACEWLRSQVADAGPRAPADGVHQGLQGPMVPASDPRESPGRDSFTRPWPGEEPPLWRRISAEQYRIATYIVVGVIAVLLIVLVSQGGR
jgi:hypothetical protein